MLWNKNELKVPHRKQLNASPNMKLVTSVMNSEWQPCGIFYGLLYHQEDEVIDPIIFAATVGLGKRVKKLISSNFMGTVSSVSVIFDTGDTYSCSSNKGHFAKLEEKKLPRQLKGISKGLEISGFGVVEYSFTSDRMFNNPKSRNLKTFCYAFGISWGLLLFKHHKVSIVNAQQIGRAFTITRS